MSVSNFISLAGLEVAEKFVVVGWWVVEHVTTVSNSNARCFRVVLSWVALGFDKNILINSTGPPQKMVESLETYLLTYIAFSIEFRRQKWLRIKRYNARLTRRVNPDYVVFMRRERMTAYTFSHIPRVWLLRKIEFIFSFFRLFVW